MSSCSIEQDEEVTRQFQRTPGTPMKVASQTPRKSSRKRCLFSSTTKESSPEKSDDLGPMSPLSLSSDDSYRIGGSPCFSPNGKFSTPPRTPDGDTRLQRERTSKRKIEITTSLFPNLKLNSPKSRSRPYTPRRSERLTPRKSEARSSEDVLKELTTPPKSYEKAKKSINDGTDSDLSGDVYSSTPRRNRQSLMETQYHKSAVSRLGIKTISCESFYGPAKPPPKVRTQLFIDSLGPKIDARKRVRSVSMDSLASNRSFVSGCQKRRKVSDTFIGPKILRNKSRKKPKNGVWHAVKKPKRIKNKSKYSKLSMSNLNQMIDGEKLKPKINVKPKRLLEEKPRKGVAKKKIAVDDIDENFDSFSYYDNKRKKLTMLHPSSNTILNQEDDSPDPNKKFIKYGKRRKMTFTLNENLKLQFSNGAMKLQSPKKRRKLYSGRNEALVDFWDDDDEKHITVQHDIENILSNLDSIDKDEEKSQKIQIVTPGEIGKTVKDNVVNTLDRSESQKNFDDVLPSKILTEIKNNSVDEMFAFNRSPGEDTQKSRASVISHSSNHVKTLTSLEVTGSLLSNARSVLMNPDLTLDAYPLSDDEDHDENNSKFYSLFYKENWNNPDSGKEYANKNSAKKKSIKVPDDQYLLDAGQKSIGIVTCGKCGVMYQAGDFADEATHKNFHNHLPELRFTGWTNERLVGRYLDGRIIMIVSTDPKPWWHKIKKIVDIVDQELGFSEGSVKSLYYKTVYLYINERAKQIVGCLIAEECKEAYKMFPPLEGVDVDSCSKDPSPCKVGISRIWTALNHRRRGVAKRMIDCMRRSFIFGEVVPMDLIAFSVPSPSGKLLAQNVTGKLDFLVYGFI